MPSQRTDLCGVCESGSTQRNKGNSLRLGLSETQEKVYSLLKEAGVLRQRDIARQIPERRRQTLCTALEILEKRGFIDSLRWDHKTYYYFAQQSETSKSKADAVEKNNIKPKNGVAPSVGNPTRQEYSNVERRSI
jgi:Fe2+ or Zn2+ uptake regulation protein